MFKLRCIWTTSGWHTTILVTPRPMNCKIGSPYQRRKSMNKKTLLTFSLHERLSTKNKVRESRLRSNDTLWQTCFKQNVIRVIQGSRDQVYRYLLKVHFIFLTTLRKHFLSWQRVERVILVKTITNWFVSRLTSRPFSVVLIGE